MNTVYRILRALSRITLSDALKVFFILAVLSGLGLCVRKIWVVSERNAQKADADRALTEAALKVLAQIDGSTLIPLEKDDEFVAIGQGYHQYVVRNKITHDVRVKVFSYKDGWTTLYTIREHK